MEETYKRTEVFGIFVPMPPNNAIEKRVVLPQQLTDRYVMGPVLGRYHPHPYQHPSGQFALVKKCTEKQTGDEYAVKIIDKVLFLALSVFSLSSQTKNQKGSWKFSNK